MYRNRSVRRLAGVVWDVATFWPRWFHPWSPPAYGERAVPQLGSRLDHLGARTVLSAHSQGSVLAVATLATAAPATRPRVALLTHGSPLSRLYSHFFPEYFSPELSSRVAQESAGWVNLWRPTDFIGGPIEAEGVDDREVVDPPSSRPPYPGERRPVRYPPATSRPTSAAALGDLLGGARNSHPPLGCGQMRRRIRVVEMPNVRGDRAVNLLDLPSGRGSRRPAGGRLPEDLRDIPFVTIDPPDALARPGDPPRREGHPRASPSPMPPRHPQWRPRLRPPTGPPLLPRPPHPSTRRCCRKPPASPAKTGPRRLRRRPRLHGRSNGSTIVRATIRQERSTTPPRSRLSPGTHPAHIAPPSVQARIARGIEERCRYVSPNRKW